MTYNPLAMLYSDRFSDSSYYSNKKYLIQKYVLPGFQPKEKPLIIDMGCGTGDNLRIIKEMGFNNILGVDSSVEMYNIAKQYIPIENNDFYSYMLKSGKNADLCICQAFIHLFPSIEFKDTILPLLMQKCKRRLYITTTLHNEFSEGFETKENTNVVRWRTRYTLDKIQEIVGFMHCRNYDAEYHIEEFHRKDGINEKWLVLIIDFPIAWTFSKIGVLKYDLPNKQEILDYLINITDKSLHEKSDEYVRYGSTTSDILRIEKFSLGHYIDAIKKQLEYDLGYGLVLMKEKINYKPPNESFPPHQDQNAGWIQTDYVNVSISIDASTRENGAVEFADNEYELLSKTTESIPFYIASKLNWQIYETQPGDTIIFNGMIPHKSGPNTTNKNRRICFITFGFYLPENYRDEYYRDKLTRQLPVDEWKPNQKYTKNDFGKFIAM